MQAFFYFWLINERILSAWVKSIWGAGEQVQQLRALTAQSPALLPEGTQFVPPCPGEVMPLAFLGTCIHVRVCAKVHPALKIIQSKRWKYFKHTDYIYLA